MQLSSEPSELQEEEEAVANATGDVQWLDEVQPPHEFEPEAEPPRSKRRKRLLECVESSFPGEVPSLQ
ncbi:hypothetical protein V5799_013285 [Amblyomma americanum]|uniref:Uncharacterized protein n=1 Tax=Amblyomma americanum TaxID=6943 RepID=A0AAQ4E6B6_AMBAM